MTPARKPDIPRIGLAAEIQTCFNCDPTEAKLATVTANYHRLRAELGRLKRALQREAHSMDPREPHRRKV
jgi:hypothetical protein